jgi:hypothetical protein
LAPTQQLFPQEDNLSTTSERSARRQKVTRGNSEVNLGQGNLPEQSGIGEVPDNPKAAKPHDNAPKQVGTEGPGCLAGGDKFRDELQKALV